MLSKSKTINPLCFIRQLSFLSLENVPLNNTAGKFDLRDWRFSLSMVVRISSHNCLLLPFCILSNALATFFAGLTLGAFLMYKIMSHNNNFPDDGGFN